jgi:hypothetical protein
MYFFSGLFCLRMCLRQREFPNYAQVPGRGKIPKTPQGWRQM